MKNGIKTMTSVGLSLGSVMFIMFSSYGLFLWYGVKLISSHTTSPTTDKPYTGGDVMTVFFSVLMGAMSIGMAIPNVPLIIKGQVSAFPLFGVIDRKPLFDSLSDEGLTNTVTAVVAASKEKEKRNESTQSLH